MTAEKRELTIFRKYLERRGLKLTAERKALFDEIFGRHEHLEADEASCRALAERLGPEGVGVFTVPAFGFLWSQHDVILHHHRRYGRAGFNAMLRRAGLEVVYSSYFNAILFPAVAAARLAQRLLRLRSEHDDTAALPPRPVNALLGAVFAAERLAIPALRLPFGVSIVSVVRRAA